MATLSARSYEKSAKGIADSPEAAGTKSMETENMKNPNCPACTEYRMHTVAEFRQYHPMAGEGTAANGGWTSDQAKAAHDADVERAKAAAKDPAGADLAQRRAEESRAIPQASAPAGTK